MVGLVLVIVLLVLAATGHSIAPYPEHITGSIDTAMRFKPPSWAHWMGTNELGQDVLSLVLGGARIVRAHDVAATRDALRVAEAIVAARQSALPAQES
jgi:ABC-type dipeptide/oligopeptide/nickel transport system permease subunit